jgi:dCMP deaminase
MCTAKGFFPIYIYCPDDIRTVRLAKRDNKKLEDVLAELDHPSEKDVFDYIVKASTPKLPISNAGTFDYLYSQLDEFIAAHKAAKPEEHADRPSWHTTFMNVAQEVAKRSTCTRRSVGAVLVKDKRIIATGYNGAPKNLSHCTPETCLRKDSESGNNLTACRAVHAEENCIIQAASFGTSTLGSELYVTCFPCAHCAKTLINAGVKHVYYTEKYNSELAEKLLKEAGIETTQI